MDISNDDDAPPMDQTQATTYQHTLLYVVQKCWHSGPKQHVPVDMHRLFHSQREAEEAAYHSALAFHKVWSKPGSGDSVKTLLLPSYPAHNPQGSSYGFLACGGLFWVRALRMTIVAANQTNHNPGMCHSAAYAILTEGVIGGTGNRNSRRGTEACDGRVFGGDATAMAMAMEAVTRVRANLTNPSLVVETKTVPVGKPPAWLSAGAFCEDWPVQAELGNQTTPSTVPFGTTPKRHMGNINSNSSSNNTNNCWGRSVSDEDFSSNNPTEPSAVIEGSGSSTSSGMLVVDCPFEEPIAKRRRVVSMTDEYGDHTMMIQ